MNAIIKKKWDYNKDVDKMIENLKKSDKTYALSDTQLKILHNRGYDTPDKIYGALYSGMGDLIDTRKMKDAQKASDLIRKHIEAGNKIVIMTDYDSDGAHGGAIGVILLKKAGANVSCYSNNRFMQGYGLLPSSIKEIKEKYPDVKLIITVDNGIVAHKGVNEAKKHGMDIIITDHHMPGDKLPDADAIVDHKRKDSTYPEQYLCGAGVIFKLLMLVFHDMGKNVRDTYEVLDLVAMATVGDIVPLKGENRILVKEGLKLIRKEERKVFEVFREITDVKEVNTHYTLGYVYIPMINAVGRLDGSIDKVIDMYLEEDKEKITEYAKYLKNLNDERKAITKEQYKDAEEFVEKKYDEVPHVIVIYNEKYHEGIIGLIAGRLKEKYNRPTFVFTKNSTKPNIAKASARSIEGFHSKNSLDDLEDMLVGYGGHAMASGLSIEIDKLDEFEIKINEKAREVLTEEHFAKTFEVDDYFYPKDLDVSIVDEINQLEPFGEAFRAPIFALKIHSKQAPLYMGDGTHAKISDKKSNVSMILWNHAEELRKKLEMSRKNEFIIKALGYPSINIFRGQVNLQFTIKNDNYKIKI